MVMCVIAICLCGIMVCMHQSIPLIHKSTFDGLLCHRASLPDFTTVKMMDARHSAVLFHPTAVMFGFTQHLYDIRLLNIYHLSHTCRIQAAVRVLNIIECDHLLWSSIPKKKTYRCNDLATISVWHQAKTKF